MEVYNGMVAGIHSKQNDLEVNVTKEKQKTNVRSANKDNTVVLRKFKKFSLEESIQFLEDDEYCEVTPESIRIRKKTSWSKSKSKI